MSETKDRAVSLLASVISRDKAQEIVDCIIEAAVEELPIPEKQTIKGTDIFYPPIPDLKTEADELVEDIKKEVLNGPVVNNNNLGHLD